MAFIEVKNLEKIYTEGETSTTAIQDISFSLRQGEFVAIMGPSGSGKSTLLHILGFLDHATRGEYRFNGKTMADFSPDEIAKVRNEDIGFIFQAFNLLPRTSVLENVKLPLAYSGVKENLWNDLAKKAIDSVGLSQRMNHEPAQLSGGEKQRVAIARSLINNPKIIFADEPTGNLDSKSGDVVIGILQNLNEKEGRTIILITHETEIAEHAQRIIHIKDGKIESDEPVAKRRQASALIK